MTEERVDVLDERMNRIGMATRDEVHAKGWWHQTFHCWIACEEGDNPSLILQERHADKKEFPAKYDTTVAGHLLTGERPADGMREMEEEIGLRLPFEKLLPVGIVKDVIPLADGWDREFCHMYFYEIHKPIDYFILQEGEVAGLVRIAVNEMWDLFTRRGEFVHATGFTVRDGSRCHIQKRLGRDDFVPHQDHYFRTALEAAKCYFASKA